MGTNYYWYPSPACASCRREYEPIHIGKSSYGWVFALHVQRKEYDDFKGAYDLEGWKILFGLPYSYIKDEYGDIISKDKMLDIITNRKGKCELVRNDIDHNHCIGHGDGTYDLIVGEFS